MKIIQLNCVYGRGSTGKLVKDLHLGLLEQKHIAYAFYARGSAPRTKNVKKLSSEFVVKIQSLISKLTGYVYGGSWITTQIFLHIIEDVKPDIVHLQCINANTINIYKVLKYLKKRNIPTLLTMHAEFLYTGGCVHALDCEEWHNECKNCLLDKRKLGSLYIKRTHYHWNKMKEIYSNFNNLQVIGVSDWVKMRAQQSMLPFTREVKVIYNGVDTNIFNKHNKEEQYIIAKKYNIPLNKKVVLHVTPNFKDPAKGREYFLQIANNNISKSNIGFVISGFNDNASLLPNNVIPIPFISDASELGVLYSLSSLTMLLSQRETFSMICAESLCCGTPIIGFKAGGPERISLKKYSFFTEYGDINGIIMLIDKLTQRDSDSWQEISICAKEQYAKERMITNYINVYKELLEV